MYPTFVNALRGTPFEFLIAKGMKDPRASMTASTLYGLVTGPYHDLAKAWQGVAYDGGGPLRQGWTMAYNGTGHDEWVSTSKPEKQAVAQPVGGTITIELRGDGPITQAMIQTASMAVTDGLDAAGFALATGSMQR